MTIWMPNVWNKVIVCEDEEQQQVAEEQIEGEKEDWTAFLVDHFTSQ
jgi:hypothetical protein